MLAWRYREKLPTNEQRLFALPRNTKPRNLTITGLVFTLDIALKAAVLRAKLLVVDHRAAILLPAVLSVTWINRLLLTIGDNRQLVDVHT